MKLAPWLDGAWRALAARMADGRLPHALLFAGAPGLGKRDLVDAFVRAALCEARALDGHACGHCRACLLLAAGSHPDRVHVTFESRDDGKPRSEIIVEQVRQMSQRLSLASQFGGLQVAVIDPGDAMNASAANALLKTLEEPSSATVILLVADRPARLPATIRSRCQRIEVKPPAVDVARDWLVGQGVAAKAAEAALSAMLGNPGQAKAAVESDVQALREGCARDLAALRRGGNVLATAEAWNADRPGERLWHAAVLVRSEAIELARGSAGRFGLTGADEIPKLAAWFAAATRAREWLDTPLRSELVVLDLLQAWQAPRRT
ncbi:MAG: DNA polymerase III subunit delta' [Xanthomonadales bacterium]|nr:DNA polymerase III subunit delta' [Xanthomonadales bacterium]